MRKRKMKEILPTCIWGVALGIFFKFDMWPVIYPAWIEPLL